MRLFKTSVLLIALSVCSMFGHSQATKAKPLHVIFDTDMATDYDDIGAITLLHYYADQGKVDILATIANTKYPRIAGVLSVMNTYFKRPDIPIGVPTGRLQQNRTRKNGRIPLLPNIRIK